MASSKKLERFCGVFVMREMEQSLKNCALKRSFQVSLLTSRNSTKSSIALYLYYRQKLLSKVRFSDFQ